MRTAMLVNLAMFSIVVSGPLVHMLVMTKAQRALSAPAYIELRQHINPVMNRRVPVIYTGTLVTTLLLLVLALWSRDRVVICHDGDRALLPRRRHRPHVA
jgi:hypothetical protein